MAALHVILLILALVFFIVAAVVGYTAAPDGARPGWHRTNYVAVGLACWVATELLVALRLT
jgi:ABC-type transporter Mla subunit MlaD